MKLNKEDDLTKILDIKNNPLIQLIFKYKQIEIKVSGLINNDCNNVELIFLKKFLFINNQIIVQGFKKLNIIEKLINLKKIISFNEWKHKCMVTNFAHMKQQLHFIKKTKV